MGRTLILREWLVERGAAWRRWKCERVPGTATRCFLWNLALIYLVAGLWKWASPMWRDGIALYAVLKLPISLTPEFWGPEHLSLLKVLNYGALILEPRFPSSSFCLRGIWQSTVFSGALRVSRRNLSHTSNPLCKHRLPRGHDNPVRR